LTKPKVNKYNRFPINSQEVRPTTEPIIATIEGEELSESEDFPIVNPFFIKQVNSLLLYISQDCNSELNIDITFLSNLKKSLQQTSILLFYH